MDRLDDKKYDDSGGKSQASDTKQWLNVLTSYTNEAPGEVRKRSIEKNLSNIAKL
jgi:hypothetical protein